MSVSSVNVSNRPTVFVEVGEAFCEQIEESCGLSPLGSELNLEQRLGSAFRSGRNPNIDHGFEL